MLQGLVSYSDVAKVVRFIASQPELALGAITSSLCEPCRTYSSDKGVVQFGMLLLVASALYRALYMSHGHG